MAPRAAAVSWLLSAGAAAAAGAVALPAPPAPRAPGSDNPFEKKKDDKIAPKPTAPAPPPLLSYDEADVQPLRHELERVVLAARQTHQETYGVAAMSRDNPDGLVLAQRRRLLDVRAGASPQYTDKDAAADRDRAAAAARPGEANARRWRRRVKPAR